MRWLREKSAFILVSALLGAVMLMFLVVPVTSSLVRSASGIPAAAADKRTISAIFTSFSCALTATLFSLVFGVPLSYIFTRHDFPGKKLVDSILDLPIIIPHNAAGIALLVVLSPTTVVGRVLSSVGISFLDTTWGIVAAMAFVSAPFMIRSAQDAFESVDTRVEWVAMSLGASRFEVFTNITLPLAYKGVLTGCLLTWARAVSEFGAVVVLSYYPKTIPVHLYDVFLGEGLKAALPVNGILMLFSVIFLVAYRVLTTRGEG